MKHADIHNACLPVNEYHTQDACSYFEIIPILQLTAHVSLGAITHVHCCRDFLLLVCADDRIYTN